MAGRDLSGVASPSKQIASMVQPQCSSSAGDCSRPNLWRTWGPTRPRTRDFHCTGTYPGGPVKWFVAFLRKVSITWADLSFQISSGSALRSRAGAFFLTITPADSL